MLTKELIQTYEDIIFRTLKIVQQNIESNDLTGRVNFASIYARSDHEYMLYNKNLSQNGFVFDKQNSGIYYKLNTPLKIKNKIITICRVRKNDSEHTERGYCDFETKNYFEFRKKYANRKNFSVLKNQHGIEMIELRVPNSDVRVYFPNTWV